MKLQMCREGIGGLSIKGIAMRREVGNAVPYRSHTFVMMGVFVTRNVKNACCP